jgi:WD40 repeat protein
MKEELIPAPRLLPAPEVDPAQTRIVQELKHTSPLIGCRFDPLGSYVFAGSQDNSVQRWHLASGKKTDLVGHKSWVRALAFAGWEKRWFSASWDGKLLSWPLDVETPTPQATVEAHKGWVRALAVNPAGKLLASCGNDHLVKLWSIPDLRLVQTFAGHSCHVYNVAFHPGGSHLVSADLKGILKVWDTKSGKEERVLDAKLLNKYDTSFGAEIGGVRSMAFNAEGSLLACAGITDVTNAFAGIGKPVVVLFDWQSGKVKHLLRPRENFQGTGWGVAFHPAGYVVGVGGGSGGALWYWKPDGPADVFTLKLPNNGRDLDLHPDGKRLAIPFFDGAVRVYDLSKKMAASAV